MEKEILKKLMSELGKKSAQSRDKKYGNFGSYMAEIKRKKKLSPLIVSNGLTDIVE